MLKLSTSILAADFARLGEQLQEIEAAEKKVQCENCEVDIHIDVMDGVFVPSISFGMPIVQSVRRVTNKTLDVHLMITEPERYIDAFAKSGADMITFHLEATRHPREVIRAIHAKGLKAGMTIKPGTSVEAVYPYLKDLQMVLIMTVEPGFGGQKFMPASRERIRQLREYLTEHQLEVDLQVDGGVYLDNVREVLEMGANNIVAGTGVFRGDLTDNVTFFLETFREFCRDERNKK